MYFLSMIEVKVLQFTRNERLQLNAYYPFLVKVPFTAGCSRLRLYNRRLETTSYVVRSFP